VVPDGVFARDERGVRFVPLGPPADSELETILRRAVIRLRSLLRPRSEALEMEQPDALASAQSEALLLPAASSPDPPRRGRHSAFLEGFSLHAGVHLHANDREGLEKLCGYGARPPLSLERLSALPDGRLAYRLKRPLPGGREILVLQPTELLRRLATLVPPPRRHLVRYHGVFAPNSAWRAEIVPRPPQARAVGGQSAQPEPSPAAAALSPFEPAPPDPGAGRSAPVQTRMPWSELLLRVFREDLLQCLCGGRRVVLAFVNDDTVVKKILEHPGGSETPRLFVLWLRGRPCSGGGRRLGGAEARARLGPHPFSAHEFRNRYGRATRNPGLFALGHHGRRRQSIAARGCRMKAPWWAIFTS
jgi:hypothetical protein